MGLTQLDTGRYRVRGRSLGGLYTSLQVPELDALLDVGTALRCAAATKYLFLSHGHGDHSGALPALLAMRALTGVRRPLQIFTPEALSEHLRGALEAYARVHGWPLEAEVTGLAPGDDVTLRKDLTVRAFQTFHRVPSLGYLFVRKVDKLKAEYQGLEGREIARLRAAGEPLFQSFEHLELAYATDTRPRVFDACPELYEVHTLIMELTFLDARKPVEAARAGGHIHLDELLPSLDRFRNEAIVPMHFSQLYSPRRVREILAARCPASFLERLHPMLPECGDWWD